MSISKTTVGTIFLLGIMAIAAFTVFITFFNFIANTFIANIDSIKNNTNTSGNPYNMTMNALNNIESWALAILITPLLLAIIIGLSLIYEASETEFSSS